VNQADFATLKLQPALLANLAALGYSSMTPIQAQSLPAILQGKDVIAQGKTGSGKTAAFALGMLEQLNTKHFQVQSLVLCPTRELADQVAREIRRLARTIPNIKVLTLCGGMPLGPQVGSLEHGAHIVVGTPGRIEEHLRKNTLRLDWLKILVLDEADRMLDMGFQPTLDAIIDKTPEQRQTLLFSATYPETIQSIATRVMRQPVSVQVASTHDSASIEQHFYRLDDEQQRMTACRLLLLHHRPESAVVFCNTKRETQEVASELRHHGFSVLALHGDLEQRDRDQALLRFANKSASILVATDVAARGLDIDAIDAVINFHLARESEVHVHRIGRTGRAGNRGIACTLYTEQERYKLNRVQGYEEETDDNEPLPPASLLQKPAYQAAMDTLQIDGGKKAKIRPGDILGALTSGDGIAGKQVGKIHILERSAYVAVSRDATQEALNTLTKGKLKGRSFKVRLIQN
jgi:ATP-independent RNA helicase DbpA